jgi:anaerobic magnesium-protoporphyrin IX monomethyl ester cyclase
VSELVRLPVPRSSSARPENADIPYLLVNPPLTDPTYPYHSISYLVASCHERGFTGYRCLDANIEALNHLARPEYVAGLLDTAARVRAQVEATDRPTRADEMRYQAALSGVGVRPDFVRRAIEVFRSPEHFYDYPTYRQAAMAAHRFVNLLSLRTLPGLFSGFSLRTNGPVNYLSQTDLSDPAVLDLVTGAFADYITGPFRRLLSQRRWRLVGLSVNYSSQLPFALRMAREVRSACPDAVVVFGGTEVCDDVKYARDATSVWRIFADADLVVPGEGETPLVDILCAIRDGTPFDGIAGVLTPGSDTRDVRPNYEHVGRLPAPRYDVWDWSAYWSPEPVVLYSPTRGCYWNKCTFCDYGLNTDRPTSPSRERPVEQVMSDLREISRFARTLYFSVDAMSPRYLRRLAESMAEADLGLRWSAELRLERTFPRRGTAALLRRAGCVSIAFGYESATQRILDLIDKGVDIATVPAILERLAEAGIGAQMMGFTGFPSETPDEARETYAFLARHRSLWTLAGVGEFSLTPGSIVARQPDRFGVEVLPQPESHDIARVLAWRDLTTGRVHAPGEADEAIDPALRAQIRRGLVGRPFVGGVDASHTLLYFARNGRRLLPDVRTAGPHPPSIVDEQLVWVPFADVDDFCSVAELEAAHGQAVRDRGGVRHADMAAWLAEPGRSRPGRSLVLLTPGGAAVGLGRPDGDTGTDTDRILRSLRILLNPAAQ